MALKIVECIATPSSIRVFFSDAVSNAETTGNYQILLDDPTTAQSLPVGSVATYHPLRQAVDIEWTASPSPLKKGDLIAVIVNINNVTTLTGDKFPKGSNWITTRVNGKDDIAKTAEKATRAVEDAVAYPVLTEEVSFSPSSTARPPGGTAGGSGAGSLGQVVTQAVGDVLGWKVKATDAKGFVGALNASFSLTTVEGHTEATWTPRTYAVQTDLSGGITGAQASIYVRAQGALDQSLPLLDGLYKLDPATDDEDIAALKAVAGSQLRELVGELPRPGGPRVSRINQYFLLLLGGASFPPPANAALTTDPDLIGGTLGTLRDKLGLRITQDFVNTLDDEQDLSNFRIMADYVTSLAQSWINNLSFFGLDTSTPFFGTQLVLLSRQLSVVAETVDEVRFTLDSVFIGPAERQTLELHFASGDPPLFAEDLFNWIADFAGNEGPRLIQDGGKFGVQNSFLPIATQLHRLVEEAQDPNPLNRHLPRGFHTSRVQRALRELADQLEELVNLATPVTHAIVEEPTMPELAAMREEVAVLRAEVRETTQSRPKLVAFPPSITFVQKQRVGTTSDPQIVTLFNSGAHEVTIESIDPDLLSQNPGDFNLVQPRTFPIALEADAALAVVVDFAPTGGGQRSAKLTVKTAQTLTPSFGGIPLVGTAGK